MTTGFQTFVNQQPAPAVLGDFASVNPRASVPAGGDGILRAGSDPLLVGNFAWGNPDTGVAESNSANGGLIGFVHRNQTDTIITAFLGESRLAVQVGFPVTLFARGEFWASFPAGAALGAAVYANNTTGAPQTDPTGATITAFVVASTVPVPAVSTASATIAAATGVMTIGAVASGAFAAGQRITGVGITGRATITRQLTGSAGGAGTYQTDYTNKGAVATTTVTGVAGTLAKISTWIQPTP